MDLGQRLGKGVRRQEDHGAAGTQSGLDLGSGQPVVQREQDGVGDGRGEEELEDMMAVRQQDGDGRLLPGGLPVLGPGQSSSDAAIRETRAPQSAYVIHCPVHPIGRSRLVLSAGSAEEAGHIGEIRPGPPDQLGRRAELGRCG